MNKDLLIDGEKYISAKRAQENLGYSADYIGQLARSGAVSGKMVGRTWYISRRSLLSYRKDSSDAKSARIGRPPVGKKDIYFNGEKFISSIRASVETGYTTDYIGQLARSGAVSGKLMGRTWYVSRKSLLTYKKKTTPVLRPSPSAKPAAQSVTRSVSRVSNTKTFRAHAAPVAASAKPLAYAAESLPALPNINKQLSKEKFSTEHPHFLRNVVSFALSLVIILGVAYTWLEYISPAMADNINIKIASTMDSVDSVGQAVNTRIAEAVRPVKTGSSYVATALGSGVKSFFSGIFSGVLPTSAPVSLVKAPTKAAAQGVVVTTETGNHASAVESIKSIFSDQVVVTSDADGASGIITPVFTSSTSSEKYTYVLVPVNDSKK